MCVLLLFFFKQKTADEMRISDWSSDVCSSDLFFKGRHVREAFKALRCHNAKQSELSCLHVRAGLARGREAPLDLIAENRRHFWAGANVGNVIELDPCLVFACACS